MHNAGMPASWKRCLGTLRGTGIIRTVSGGVPAGGGITPEASSLKLDSMRQPRLRFSVEHGVPAAHVSQNEMVLSRRVPQVHAVLLTGVPAVVLGVPIGQKSAEHAMLGVEDWEVLMQHHLEAMSQRFWKVQCQVSHLVCIEVMSQRQA